MSNYILIDRRSGRRCPQVYSRKNAYLAAHRLNVYIGTIAFQPAPATKAEVERWMGHGDCSVLSVLVVDGSKL